MTAIHQFVPTLAPQDAVGGHYLAVQAALRDVGYSSEIYAWEAKGAYARSARPYDSFPGGKAGEPTWLLYHSSIGSPVAEYVIGRPEPLILDYHNITPASFFMRWEPYVAARLALGRRQLTRLSVRTELGLADSAYNARELQELQYDDVAVVPILLDTAAMGSTPADPDTLSRLDAAKSAGGTDWLFVGRLSPNKAQHDIVKAFAAYHRFHDNRARLHLVGGSSSSAYLSALRVFVEKLGLAAYVDIAGAVSDGAKRAYYECADLFVICSDHEGFCVPALEAMFYRLPIVAYAAAAVPETLGDAAVLLPSKDPCLVASAAARVVNDAQVRTQLVTAGVDRLDDFDIARSRRSLVEVIQRTVEIV